MPPRKPRRRIRRTAEAVEAAAMSKAGKGAFTSQELASEVGFTSNRARQLLEALKKRGKLEVLGTRRSLRGKPSKLWGLPGTRLTEEDVKARRRPSADRSSSAGPSVAPGGAFLDRLWKALEIGLEIQDPAGQTYTVRLARD